MTLAEQVVPCQCCIVCIICTRNIRDVGQTICRPLVSTEQCHVLVGRTIAGVQVVIDTVSYMIVQSTKGRDAQVKVLVLQMSTQTEVHLGQTTAKHSLVVSVNHTVRLAVRTADILIETVTNVGTLLSSMVVKVGLCTGDALINPTIELTYFLTYVCSVSTGNIRISTET